MPEPGPQHWLIRSPQSDADWQAYYELRWRILRAPWQQPRGSERDELEAAAIHRMVCTRSGEVVAVGRLHRREDGGAAIRYMAVEAGFERRGLGTLVLKTLEQLARDRGMTRIGLQARDHAVPFYRRHGYRVVAPSHRLFGVIQHYRMEKFL